MKKTCKHIMIAIVFTIVPVTLFAATPITIEGEFQGANCIFYNKTCPHNMTDGHVATEPDFVFVYGKGKYVFIPNLDRGLKIKYMHTKVKIIGKMTGDSVRAEIVKLKKGGKYTIVWSLTEQEKERMKMNQK